MLTTFDAVLKGNQLEWTNDVPLSDRPRAVRVTILDIDSTEDVSSRGEKMAEALEKLAQSKAYSDVEPMTWQRELRQDRSLPQRN
ncbi:MAG: hypothetical protein GDA44_12930 [Prochloron sp. SP5CPC1]|nr:hypothetical protein [Candidatus Paraprochloron terpiosi SP5CPC1]